MAINIVNNLNEEHYLSMGMQLDYSVVDIKLEGCVAVNMSSVIT